MKINLKDNITVKSLRFFLILVLCYGFIELIMIIPSIKIFLVDHFYIDSLKIRGFEGGQFLRFLIYMNTSLIVIISSSILYIFFGIQGLLAKKWAIVSIKYMSCVMLIYNLLELILFPGLTVNELKDVFNNSSIVINMMNLVVYFKYIILYLIMILFSQIYFEKMHKNIKEVKGDGLS